MKKKIVVGVLGLPVRKDGKILLTKRHAPGRKDWHNKWQLAGGGLDYGETTEECLRREVWEELHVKVKKILHSNPIVKTSIWYSDEEQTKMDAHILLIGYLIDIGDQEPDLTKDPDWETSDCAWFTQEEAMQLDMLPLTDDFVEAAYTIIDKNGIL